MVEANPEIQMPAQFLVMQVQEEVLMNQEEIDAQEHLNNVMVNQEDLVAGQHDQHE